MSLKQAKFKKIEDWYSSAGGKGVTPLGVTNDEFLDRSTGAVYKGRDVPPTVEMFVDYLTFNFVNDIKDADLVDKFISLHGNGSGKCYDALKWFGLYGFPCSFLPGFQGYKRRFFFESPFQNEGKAGGVNFLVLPDPECPNKSAYTKEGEPLSGFDISGSGCRLLDSLGVDWKELFTKLMTDLSARVSRLDFSFDFINFDFPLVELLTKLTSYDFTSPYWTICPDYGIDLHTRTFNRFILRLGSPDSDNFITMYDKGLEQANQGRSVPFRNVFRVEMHFKGERAKAFILDALENWNTEDMLAGWVSQFLYHQLDIKERPAGCNSGLDATRKQRSRWPTWDFWSRAVGAVGKCALRRRPDLHTSINKSADWVNRDVSKSISELLLADPEKFDLVSLDNSIKGLSMIEEKDLIKVNAYRRMKNLPEVAMADVKVQLQNLINDLTSRLVSSGLKREEIKY